MCITLKSKQRAAVLVVVISALVAVLVWRVLSDKEKIECRVHKRRPAPEIAKYKHGKCALVEFSGFIQSQLLGGFIPLEDGRVNHKLSNCYTDNGGLINSNLYIEFHCGFINFQFVKNDQSGDSCNLVKFGYQLQRKQKPTETSLSFPKLETKSSDDYVLCTSQQVAGGRSAPDEVDYVDLYLSQLRMEMFRQTDGDYFEKKPSLCEADILGSFNLTQQAQI